MWKRRGSNREAGGIRFHFVEVAVLLATLWAHSVLSHRSQVFGPAFTHGDRNGDMVALTFDDGPNDPYTTQILDILQARSVKATFFIIGENAMQFPDTVRREVAEGMELGNHTYNHGSVVRAQSQTIEWQIDETQETLQRIAGVQPKWFRPPHGFRDPRLFTKTQAQRPRRGGMEQHAQGLDASRNGRDRRAHPGEAQARGHHPPARRSRTYTWGVTGARPSPPSRESSTASRRGAFAA